MWPIWYIYATCWLLNCAHTRKLQGTYIFLLSASNRIIKFVRSWQLIFVGFSVFLFFSWNGFCLKKYLPERNRSESKLFISTRPSCHNGGPNPLHVEKKTHRGDPPKLERHIDIDFDTIPDQVGIGIFTQMDLRRAEHDESSLVVVPQSYYFFRAQCGSFFSLVRFCKLSNMTMHVDMSVWY